LAQSAEHQKGQNAVHHLFQSAMRYLDRNVGRHLCLSAGPCVNLGWHQRHSLLLHPSDHYRLRHDPNLHCRCLGYLRGGGLSVAAEVAGARYLRHWVQKVSTL
jgi:hypothetical protein